MDFGYDDPVKKYRVLKAVEDQCRPRLADGRRGQPWQGVEAVQLSVDGMESEEISNYCFVLSELKLITSVTFQSIEGDFVYPVSLTLAGHNFLKSAERSLVDAAKLTAVEILKQWTGIDLNHPAFQSLSAAFQLYEQHGSIR